MKRERERPSQFSFLPPEDAALVNLMRHFVTEASRIYEVRTGTPITEVLQIRSSRDAYEFLRPETEHLEQEQLHTIQLNTKHRILSTRLIYQGTLDTTTVRIAEVFRPAILDNASSIIICHNHPTGDPTPSPDDACLTRQLVRAGDLLGIEVLDHIVVGKGSYTSLKELKLGFL